MGNRAGGDGPAVRLPPQGSSRGGERADPRLRRGAPRSPRDGDHDDRRGSVGRSLLPDPGRRQPGLPDPERGGGAAHEGPVADATPGRGGGADGGGIRAERAAPHYPPRPRGRPPRPRRSPPSRSPRGPPPRVLALQT